jgi:hypothetical protein
MSMDVLRRLERLRNVRVYEPRITPSLGLPLPGVRLVTWTYYTGRHQLNRVLTEHNAGCTHSRVSDWLHGLYSLSLLSSLALSLFFLSLLFLLREELREKTREERRETHTGCHQLL